MHQAWHWTKAERPSMLKSWPGESRKQEQNGRIGQNIKYMCVLKMGQGNRLNIGRHETTDRAPMDTPPHATVNLLQTDRNPSSWPKLKRLMVKYSDGFCPAPRVRHWICVAPPIAVFAGTTPVVAWQTSKFVLIRRRSLFPRWAGIIRFNILQLPLFISSLFSFFFLNAILISQSECYWYRLVKPQKPDRCICSWSHISLMFEFRGKDHAYFKGLNLPCEIGSQEDTATHKKRKKNINSCEPIPCGPVTNVCNNYFPKALAPASSTPLCNDRNEYLNLWGGSGETWCWVHIPVADSHAKEAYRGNQLEKPLRQYVFQRFIWLVYGREWTSASYPRRQGHWACPWQWHSSALSVPLIFMCLPPIVRADLVRLQSTNSNTRSPERGVPSVVCPRRQNLVAETVSPCQKSWRKSISSCTPFVCLLAVFSHKLKRHRCFFPPHTITPPSTTTTTTTITTTNTAPLVLR